jgi:hypothetical protein
VRHFSRVSRSGRHTADTLVVSRFCNLTLRLFFIDKLPARAIKDIQPVARENENLVGPLKSRARPRQQPKKP